MEGCNRRSRRHHRRSIASSLSQPEKSGCLNLVYNTMVVALLISVIYMMLEYHCTSCSEKCNSTTTNISRHIQDISDNIVLMKINYNELEKKITYLSHEFPKLEGQIETLESLASGLGDNSWKIYKTPLCAPLCDSDVYKHITKRFCHGGNSNDCDRNCTEKLTH